MPPACSTPKALKMKHFCFSPHHKIIFGKNSLAGRTAGTVQPETRKCLNQCWWFCLSEITSFCKMKIGLKYSLYCLCISEIINPFIIMFTSQSAEHNRNVFVWMSELVTSVGHLISSLNISTGCHILLQDPQILLKSLIERRNYTVVAVV